MAWWARFRPYRWAVFGLLLVAAVPLTVYVGVPAAVASVAAALAPVVFDLLWERVKAEREAPAPPAQRITIQRVRDLGDPVELGVNPAPVLVGPDGPDRMPPYVRRDRTDEIRAKLRRGGFVLIVGDSTAGATREAYEAMRAELADHRFIRPAGRQELKAALAAAGRERNCVLWLDRLEGYLDGLTRAGVVALVNRPQSHVVILATMANVFFDLRATSPAPANPGTTAEAVRARTDVLDLADVVELARLWSDEEIERAGQYADDPRIAAALADVDRYGIAQHLAAGPELVKRWRSGRYPVGFGGHPLGVAIVDAAVDARRVGLHAPLPADLLRELCQPYLVRRAGRQPETESWEQALAWATELDERVAGSAMLVRQDDGWVAFTYLVDADPEYRHRRMPEQVWLRLLDHVTGEDAVSMGATMLAEGDMGRGITAIQRAIALNTEGVALLHAMLFGRGGDPAVLAELDEELADSAQELGPDHEETRGLRLLRAIYTGAGDPARGARELAELLDAYRDLPGGPEWADELMQAEAARARYTMEAGDPAGAAVLFAELIERLTADGVPDTQRLTIQLPLIVCLAQSGQWAEAAALATRVVTESTRLSGSEAPLTLLVRTWHGHALLHTGQVEVGQGRLAATVEAARRVLGARDRVTLQARIFHVEAVEATDPDRAARMADALRADLIEFLGAEDPLVIEVRTRYAREVASSGDPATARDLYRDLVDDAGRARGAVHPVTLELRRKYADQTGTAGDPAGAAELRLALTTDLARLAGPTDPATLDSRDWTAYWLGRAGRHAEAAQQYELLATGRAGHDGPTDQATLTARFFHAQQLAYSGAAEPAGRLFVQLAHDMADAHGPGYRDLAVTCAEAAHWNPAVAGEIQAWYAGLTGGGTATDGGNAEAPAA